MDLRKRTAWHTVPIVGPVLQAKTPVGLYRMVKRKGGYACYWLTDENSSRNERQILGVGGLAIFNTAKWAREMCEDSRAKLQAAKDSADEAKRLSEQFSSFNVVVGSAFAVAIPKSCGHMIRCSSGYCLEMQ